MKKDMYVTQINSTE